MRKRQLDTIEKFYHTTAPEPWSIFHRANKRKVEKNAHMNVSVLWIRNFREIVFLSQNPLFPYIIHSLFSLPVFHYALYKSSLCVCVCVCALLKQWNTASRSRIEDPDFRSQWEREIAHSKSRSVFVPRCINHSPSWSHSGHGQILRYGKEEANSHGRKSNSFRSSPRDSEMGDAVNGPWNPSTLLFHDKKKLIVSRCYSGVASPY